MTEKAVRLFSREFKLAALARMEAGENVSALARELGVKRKSLYEWRDRFRRGGPLASRVRGRPSKALGDTVRRSTAWSGSCCDNAGNAAAVAAGRFDEGRASYRGVGAQDRPAAGQTCFFIKPCAGQEARQRSGASGSTASMRSSKR